MTMTEERTDRPTERQVKYVRDLLAERVGNPDAEALRSGLNAMQQSGGLNRRFVSACIDALLKIESTPKAPAPAPAAAAPAPEPFETKKGDIHVVGDKFVRVHVSQGNGYPYACVADIIREAIWDGDTLVEPGEVEWTKVTGLIRRLDATTKAAPEQAMQFARLAGRCIYCSRAIDTPESTKVGYGPVCARKYNLPWGETTEVVAQTTPKGTGRISRAQAQQMFGAHND